MNQPKQLRIFVFTYVLCRGLGQNILGFSDYFGEIPVEINRNHPKYFRIYVFTYILYRDLGQSTLICMIFFINLKRNHQESTRIFQNLRFYIYFIQGTWSEHFSFSVYINNSQQKSAEINQNISESLFLHMFYIGDLVRAFCFFLKCFDNSQQELINISESSF